MAKTTDTSTIFRLLAILAAVLLVLAGVLIYLQGSGGNPRNAQLAALSQALPSEARAALAGEDGAFAKLDASVSRLANLRRNAGPGVPGSAGNWQQLESRAGAILAARDDIEALGGAGSEIESRTETILALSNELLDRSGATATIQEFQQRAARMGRGAPGITTRSNAITVASGLASDAAFLRSVVDALAGEDTELDVRPLDDEGREVALLPIDSELSRIEAAVQVIGDTAVAAADLTAARAELEESSAALGQAFADSSGASQLPGFLQILWIPIGMLGAAVMLVITLIFMNARFATFEQMAKEQAEQNDRNQQAILRLLDEMGSLADGDLTVEATVTEDITGTIADSFNYAIEELRKLVATVNETAIMVDSAAKQTESTASHMAKAADNQSREINAATESIVSMAASIEEVSGNAERSSDVARHSVEVAHKGGEAVRRTIDGMNTIRETIQDTSKRIKRLGESSQEIGNIIELINDIAEQTNILALNASIQASMAGEAGRGFAVVADEVQRLAERSTNATKQIEVLVRTIQADTNEAVVSMERSTTDVVGGALLAENAGAALDEIEQVSNQIASLVQNISGSARQQAGSAADVTRRTTRLREISEEAGKATTATAAAVSKLSELASQLRKTVAGFTLPSDVLQARTLQTSASDLAGPPGERVQVD
jgi:twitching motility protein PilJ